MTKKSGNSLRRGLSASSVVIPRTLWIGLIASTLVGCASYSSRIRSPRTHFESGNYTVAIEELKPLADKQDNDELLYLMDLGLVYHASKQYDLAIQTFQKAEKLADLKDYTSISQEVGSVILSDEVKVYKGEDFEKVLIHVYLAMDYALKNDREGALVECRRTNHVLDKMITEGKLPYERNAFAKYLAGVLFEAEKDYNDALVDYRQLYKWRPTLSLLGVPLLRLTDRLHMEQEFNEFRAKFPKAKDYKLGKDQGEIIVFVEAGRVPIKIPHEAFRLLPRFIKRGYRAERVVVRDSKDTFKVRSVTLYDIEDTAIRELDSRVAGIMAKKIGGVVAKEIIADQVARQTKSKFAGFLTSFVLHATDSADLRSWTTLPARLQIARIAVPAGRHDIVLDMVTQVGTEVPSVAKWDGVEVKRGETVFLNYRTPD